MRRGKKRTRRGGKRIRRARPDWLLVPRFEALEKRVVLDGTVSVVPLDPDAAEPDEKGFFKFTRNGGSGSPVTVQYSTGGTAGSGVDYTALSGQVTIPAAGTATDVELLQLPYEELNVGIQPVYFHEGDFNRDGNLDLAVASHQAVPGTLTIHMGNGTGGFDHADYYSTVGVSPRSIEVADFNDDGELDIAVANRNSSDVAIFLGNAIGTFPDVPILYDVGNFPRMINAGDFNEDGDLDFVTANYYGENITLWLGDGQGGFFGRTDFATAPPGKFSNPRSMVVEDFDKDGNLDVAVSSSTGEHATPAENVSILLGDGLGGFATPTSVAWGPDNDYSLNLTSADVNLDGNVDLVTANYFGSSLSVLIGAGDGSFAAPQHIDLGGTNVFRPRYVTSDDFNLDGNPDLAVTDSYEVRVRFFLGDGAGNFSPGQDFDMEASGGPSVLFNTSLAVNDFDNDGDNDLVAVRNLETFSVLLNQTGSGTHAIVDIDPIDDPDLETLESVTVTIDTDPNYTVGSPLTANVTIASDELALETQLRSLNDELNEPKLDGQWQGAYVASDGKLYFGSSTHAHDTAGKFPAIRPRHGRDHRTG